jgi:hypothetical protein
MIESLKAMQAAVRVLTEMTEGREPNPSDVEHLRQYAPSLSEASIDDLACEVIYRGLRRREEIRSQRSASG